MRIEWYINIYHLWFCSSRREALRMQVCVENSFYNFLGKILKAKIKKKIVVLEVYFPLPAQGSLQVGFGGPHVVPGIEPERGSAACKESTLGCLTCSIISLVSNNSFVCLIWPFQCTLSSQDSLGSIQCESLEFVLVP